MSEGNPRIPELEPDGMREYPTNNSTSSTTTSTSSTGCGCVPMLAGSAAAAAAAASSIGPGAPAPINADPTITISITPTTGGQFEITVDKNETIENLKKIISKRLKVAKERICLLHREKQLRDGTLEENRLQDGSRLTLLPSVETGLLAQRPEQSVMQALESLSDSQVNDFLSGKAPLNLTMRLGDHMMLIQLQLSTVTPAQATTTTTTTTTTGTSTGPTTPTTPTSPNPIANNSSAPSANTAPIAAGTANSTIAASTTSTNSTANGAAVNSGNSGATATAVNSELDGAQNSTIDRAAVIRRYSNVFSALSNSGTAAQSSTNCPSKLSLSSSLVGSLASAAAASTLFAPAANQSPPNTPSYGSAPSSPCWPSTPVPINTCTNGNNITPCCTQDTTTNTSSTPLARQQPQQQQLQQQQPQQQQQQLQQQQQQQQQQHRNHATRFHRHVHPARHPYHHHHHHHHMHHRYVRKVGQMAKPSCPSCTETEVTSTASPAAAPGTVSPSTTPVVEPIGAPKCSEFSFILGQCDCSKSSPKKKPCDGHANSQDNHVNNNSSAPVSPCMNSSTNSSTIPSTPMTPTTPTTPTSPDSPDVMVNDPANANPTATLDTRALVEASRNLTQKLKQLSSEENAKRRQGAIIESMHHHGKGVYTGTFSGTLNPALQDRHGRPKRDISTIIHILNDLLCATPATTAGHYRYHRHPNALRATSSSSITTSAAGAASAATASQASTMFSISSNGPATTTSIGSNGPLESTTACSDSSNSTYSNEELSKENEATKGKLRRLRLVMEQRREKMRARRQARAAPYTTKWAAVTPDPDPNASSSSTSSSSASGKSSSDPQNEPELQPCSPEPVVA